MTLSRRHFLSTGSFAALGLAFRNPLVAATSRLCEATARVATAPSIQAARLPYTVTASSTLSEDRFLTDEITLDPQTDEVAPVVNGDGSTHALVVLHRDSNPSNRVISLVCPDSSSQSGYDTSQLTELGTGLLEVAAVGRADGTIGICYVDGQGQVWKTTATSSATVTAPQQLLNVGSTFSSGLVAGVNAAGEGRIMFLYSTDNAGVDKLAVVDPFAPGGASNTPIDLRYLADSKGEMQLTDLRGAITPGVDGAADRVTGVLLSPTIGDSGTPQMAWLDGELGVTQTPTRIMTPGNGTVPNVASLAAGPLAIPAQPGSPGAGVGLLWFDAGDNVYFGLMQGNQTIALPPVQLLVNATYGPKAQAVTAAEWYWDPDAGVIRVYLLAGGTVYVQTIDMRLPAYVGQAVPLQGDVEQIYVPDRGASPATSLVVAAPSPQTGSPVLSIVSRATGTAAWATTPIHLKNPSLVDVSTYRTLLTLVDQTGVPVPNTDLVVTPDRDVLSFGATTALILPGTQATTVRTDGRGQVTLATPASVLQASGLNVRYPTGSGSTDTAYVTPDGELHEFLAGTGSVSGYPTVEDFLSQHAGGAIPNLPSDNASQSAVATAIKSAMIAGMSPHAAPGTPGAPSEYTLTGISTGTPVLTPNASSGPLRGGLTGWWDDVERDVQTVYHAIEHGLATASSVVHRWDKAAQAWTVGLVLKVQGYVELAVNYTITSLHDAVAAVHGILGALGADLHELLTLLRTLILATLNNASVIGNTLYSWLTFPPGTDLDDVPDIGIGSAIRSMRKAAAQLPGQLSDAGVASRIGQVLRGATPDPTPVARSSASDPVHVKALWVVDKIRSSSSLGGGFGPSSTTLASVQGLTSTITSSAIPQQLSRIALSAFEDAATVGDLLAGDVSKIVNGASADMVEQGLLTLAGDVAQDLFGAVEDAFVDVNDALAQPVDDLPLIGDLLESLGAPAELTVGRVACLAVGFAAAVLGGDMFPGQRYIPDAAYRSAGMPVPSGAVVAGKLGAGVSVTKWNNFLDAAFVGLNLLATGPVTVQDIGWTVQQAPPAEFDILAVVISALINVVVYPFDQFETPLSWSKDVPGGINAVLGADLLWCFGFAPVIAGLMLMVTAPEGGEDPAPGIDFANNFAPIVNCIGGAVNLVGDIVLSTAADPTTSQAILEGVLGPIPAIMSILKLGGPENELGWASCVLDVCVPYSLAKERSKGVVP